MKLLFTIFFLSQALLPVPFSKLFLWRGGGGGGETWEVKGRGQIWGAKVSPGLTYRNQKKIMNQDNVSVKGTVKEK